VQIGMRLLAGKRHDTNSDFFTGDGFVEFGQAMNHEWRPCCSSKFVQSHGRDEKNEDGQNSFVEKRLRPVFPKT
jgi:hypothetical protein